MTFYKVEEYVIEENEFEYDEDESKFVQTDFIDTLESTEMKIEVVEIPSHETIAICSSLEEAEEAGRQLRGRKRNMHNDLIKHFRRSLCRILRRWRT